MSGINVSGSSSAPRTGLEKPTAIVDHAYEAMREAHIYLQTENPDEIQSEMEEAVRGALSISGNGTVRFTVEISGSEIRLEMLGECRVLFHQRIPQSSWNATSPRHHNSTSVAIVSRRYESARESQQATNEMVWGDVFVSTLTSLGAGMSGQSFSDSGRDTTGVLAREVDIREETQSDRRWVDERRYGRVNQAASGRSRTMENRRVGESGTNRIPSEIPPTERSPDRESRNSTGDIVSAFEAGANWNGWRSSDSRPTEERAESDHYK
jgi:hypothetical protein